MIINSVMQFKNDEASKIVKFGSADVSSYSSTKFKAPTGGYRMAMRDLLKAIRDYAVYRNHPDFGIIAYGGTSIFAADKSQGWTKEKYQQLKGVIDAVIVEAYYYGLNADWVGRVNEDFDDNYNVKYWTEPWRKVLIESDGSYADVIISLGFDGIFAANIDAYENFE